MAQSADAGIAWGGRAKTAGSSATAEMVRLAATGPSGSRSANRRLTMIGAAAYPSVATRIRAAPSSSAGRPATSTPSSATTPPSPITSPNRRSPVGWSAVDRRSESSATKSGIVAMRIAVSDDEMYRSPIAMRTNGTAISQAA